MPTSHTEPATSVDNTQESHHHKVKNPHMAAWIIAGSVVLGALVVSASLFVSLHSAVKKLSGASFAQSQGSAPAAPGNVAAGSQANPTTPAAATAPVNIT